MWKNNGDVSSSVSPYTYKKKEWLRKTTKENDEERTDFNVVVERFKTFCTPKTNETFERDVFNSRIQMKTESVEEFIMDLKLKSQSCNFGTLADSLIRDR